MLASKPQKVSPNVEPKASVNEKSLSDLQDDIDEMGDIYH